MEDFLYHLFLFICFAARVIGYILIFSLWNGITALIATFVSCFFDKEDDDLVFKIVYIISLFFLVYITYCYWIHIGYYDNQWHIRWFY